MNLGQTDLLLQTYAQTADAGESERVLSALLTEHAEPIVSKIIRYKTRGGEEADDIYGEVMVQLVGRLQRLKTETNGKRIEDFNSYVAVTTYNACDRFLSRKYPQRRRLKNGLRYLLTHREGFALWQDSQGNYVGGFHRWQFGSSNGGDESSLKIQRLREDTRAFVSDVTPEKSWSEQKNAYQLLSAIFNWANAPIEIDLLTSVVADWWNVTDETVEIDVGERNEDRPQIQIADVRPDASKENERRVYLEKLWLEIIDLPIRQRAAVLLNLRDELGRGVIDLWLVVGVADAGQIAAALEMTAEEFAELWNDLPLDDNRIAEFLNLTRQQVINLRKSARERLARRMKGF